MLAGLAAAAGVPTPEEQIAVAALAAPVERRAGAEVLGYDASGKLVTLRKGANDMVCLGDDPSKDGINVACYHKDLEPFMARGRELAATGMKEADRQKQRNKEVDDGKVKMPREARMLYVLTGKSYDAAAGTLTDSYLRWVVYTPYATPESIGLPAKGGAGAPWLMSPGTAGAHIMMSPPRR